MGLTLLVGRGFARPAVANRAVAIAVLFLVHRHGRVSDERVAAVRPGAMEMAINAITVTTDQPAIYHLIEEGEAGRYVDVIVEVFAVHQ